ncbi:prefoldin beta-like domain containing protein [Heterostelium album PN500]|uniref:Prefoldin beta-like domain containing protein n=1 Tax=Heterostelium pallidum (strain ATCC 26659 / Pp 5 / PN500) TaxID=670386 RepID=D3BBW5_HETP5|nr:prefoldin beta-like domain containing protein [Heterostelium album PN500]EFA81148.1 prefoldin beta-like domain containing protein [Heterostelium album PN500]|eukprot:XP_020433266.1 prefoldin beta-like domain containing protein [Heterostelium album PN500]
MSDLEITDMQAFQEIREKLFNLNRNLNNIRQKIQVSDKDRQRCVITLKELETLPPNTKTYKSVGKMFLVAPKDTLKKELKKQVEKDEEDVKGLMNQGKYIDAQISETEKSLKELVITKK